MPWSIEENTELCPTSEPYAVTKDDDGELEGCHATMEDAEAQVTALNIAEAEEDRANPLQRLWHKIRDAFAEAGVTDEPERAMSYNRLYSAIWEAVEEREGEDYPWLIDIYTGDSDNETFAVYSAGGKLYRADISVMGETVTLGEAVQVTEEFPAVRTRTVIRQQEDGQWRWFSISCTSVLNRVSEIDSRALFDSFIARAEENDEYPYRTFYHLGEEWRNGQADYLARDGNVLITSGLFEKDNLLAEAEISARQADDDFWGESIGYIPSAPPEIMRIGDVEIPVYADGVMREISFLPEADAAAWFTNSKVTEVNRMNSKIMEALRKLAGDDEEMEDELEAFAATVDSTNRSIDEAGMITREREDEEEAPEQSEEAPEEQASETFPDGAVLELDDEMLRALVEATTASDAITEIQARVAELTEAIEQIADALTGEQEDTQRALDDINDITSRLALLEQDDDEKRQRYLADMPEPKRVRVTYRPREAHAEDENDEPETYAERAQRIAAEKGFTPYK